MVDKENIVSISFNSFFHNYEFYGESVLNPEFKRAYNHSDKMYDDYNCLYLEILDNGNALEELITGKKFIKIEDNDSFVYRYINEESGLYFLVINNDINRDIDLRVMVNKVFNIEYIKKVEKFFQYYENANNKDESLINKSYSLLLRKGINYLQK